MMKKFKNKYRIPSSRAQWWDYGSNAAYFVTICAANRECLLGKIENNEMVLSDIGCMVQQEWEKSFEIRNELFCDAFAIMPNHIHAIVRIDKNDNVNSDNIDVFVETHGRASLHRSPKSISSFIAGFKSSATKRINEIRNSAKLPVWQSRFHDRIIRNEDEYNRIKQYIAANPINWINDEFFSTAV